MDAITFVLSLFTYITVTTEAHRILIFAPGLTNSQLLLSYGLAEVLQEAGNEVTVFRVAYNTKTAAILPSNVTEIIFNEPIATQYEGVLTALRNAISAPTPKLNISLLTSSANIFNEACDGQIRSSETMEKFRNGNFDVAIAHTYDLCPLGIIKAANIPAYIWMSSGILTENIALRIGLPLVSSYLPTTQSSFSDIMNSWQRLQNFAGNLISATIYRKLFGDPETLTFRKRFGEDFPHLFDVAAQSHMLFVNSEELLDIPRPSFGKVQFIGRFQRMKTKPLEEKWNKLIMKNKAQKGIVLFSLGSLANASLLFHNTRLHMLIKTFKAFPDYLFILKWDKPIPEHNSSFDSNIVFGDWLPQQQLLAHPKMRLLITHGGYNSILEALTAGVPLAVLPLFGDQFGNLKRVERLGVGLGLNKDQLTEESLHKVLKELLYNDRYSKNARKLASMINMKIAHANAKVTKFIDLVAKSSSFADVLSPKSVELNWLQHESIDTVAFLLIVAAAISWTVFVVVRIAWYFCVVQPNRTKAKPNKGKRE